MSAHVCREHLEPVNWRGTGCRPCTAVVSAWRRRRRERQAEASRRRLAAAARS